MVKAEQDWVLDKLNEITKNFSTFAQKKYSTSSVTDSLKQRDTIVAPSSYSYSDTKGDSSEKMDTSKWGIYTPWQVIDNLLRQITRVKDVNEILNGLHEFRSKISSSGLSSRKLYQLNQMINNIKSRREFNIIELRTMLREIQNEFR